MPYFSVMRVISVPLEHLLEVLKRKVRESFSLILHTVFGIGASTHLI